ncbi:MAG: hypothetical protein GX963_06630 [Bacteroidales bacterium]|nr:hypothetical protein [Bacteroidales bacterium]
MKAKALFFYTLILSVLISCEKQEIDELVVIPEVKPGTEVVLPDGYFEVNFFTSPNSIHTKAPVTGIDARVQHVRYIIYKSTGEYVKEKEILTPVQGIPTWPLGVLKDTLPEGSYDVVFLGNVEKTLFPYVIGSSHGNYADVLINYQTHYQDARIILPLTEFSGNTEYYWAKASFSDTNPNPEILLQRMVGMLRLNRNFVDTNDAVTKLIDNILLQINYRDIIRNTLEGAYVGDPNGLLYNLLHPILSDGLLGPLVIVVDPFLNLLIQNLVEPITDALYDQIVSSLISQVELALKANATGNETGLAYLGRMLNPWAYGAEAILTIDDFPKAIDFDLNVKDYFPVGQQFKYALLMDEEGTVNEKYIAVKGFNDDYDVRKINMLAQGLIYGLVVDYILDTELFLSGVFVDVSDPIIVQGSKSNLRYKADYSFLDLHLKSYTLQTDGNHTFFLGVRIGDIANIDGILSEVITALKGLPVLGLIVALLTDAVLNPILTAIMDITVVVPLNLPLLGIENLTLSGSWSTVTLY